MVPYEAPGLIAMQGTTSAAAAFGGQVSVALVAVTVVATGTWVVALTQTSRSIKRYINVQRLSKQSTRLQAVTLPPDSAGQGI